MAEQLILVIDDEPGILKLIKQLLSDEEYRVVTAKEGGEAVQKAEELRPDLIILDMMLPDMDGMEVMRHLREIANTPIIVLTARGTDREKAAGLEMGADDYVAKPFHPEELAARVRAVLRRSQGGAAAFRLVQAGDVEIDLDRRTVTRGGETLAVTRTEWLLLQQLAANAGRVLLNPELLSKVWGPEYRDDIQYLRVWVSRLRRKLETDPANPTILKTVQGVGYVLEAGLVPPEQRL